MRLKDIIKKLEKKFPKENAEEWDNVGLLLGNSEKEIKKIQFSLDATVNSIQNAIDKKVDLIITHHPLIFRPLKKVVENDLVGSKIIKLIKNDIALYSLHTNLDATFGGINDYILDKLEISNEKIKVLDLIEEKNCGIGRIYSLEKEARLEDYIKFLKEKLEISNVRMISRDKNDKIKKIALINGSAMSYWRKALHNKVDLFITGDITYHDALDALESGMNVIDFGHYESEHFFHNILEKELENLGIEFLVFNEGSIFKNI